MSALRGPPAIAARQATLQAALEHAAQSAVGLTFVDAREQERFLSFAEIRERALRIAGALEERGVRPTDRVALVLPTSPAFCDALFGVLLAGATPVPLYPPVRLARLEEYYARTARMLEAVGARLVLTDARLRRLLGVPVQRAAPELGCLDLAQLEGTAPSPLAPTPDDLALIQYSSGTTVEPKPVALTHRAVLANLAAIDSFIPHDGAQAGVSWLPLYHDMGLIGALLLAVYHPGPLTLIPPELFLARPALWLRAISRQRATVSPAPNFAFALAARRVRDEELHGVDLGSWRLALNGAEPVTAEALGRFAERFARWGFDARALTPVYGLSEATLAVTFSAPEREFRCLDVDPLALARHGEIRAGVRSLPSVGTPLPGVAIEIRDESGRVLGERRAGRIFVQSPSLLRDYFGNRAATLAALREGWLDTGDLGFVCDGELYVCGRAKDQVIIRGANHDPREFEECLDGLAGLRAGCAVAVGVVSAGGEGEELAVLAELAADAPAGEELVREVTARIAQRTGIHPSIVRLLSPGTLPRTSSGKLRRAEAARRLAAGELTAPVRPGPLRLAREMLRSSLAHRRARRGA